MAGDRQINPIPAGRKKIDDLTACLAVIFDDKNTLRTRLHATRAKHQRTTGRDPKADMPDRN
jgi:hypothetical protein